MIRDFGSGNIGDFSELLAACADLSDKGISQCFQAMSSMSEGNKPISKYIKAIYDDPQHYCRCSNKLYGKLPSPCIFDLPGQATWNLGQVKSASCVIGDLCDEYKGACINLRDHLEMCFGDDTVDQSRCSAMKACALRSNMVNEEMLVNFGFPNGCYEHFDKHLAKNVKKFEHVCLGIAAEGKEEKNEDTKGRNEWSDKKNTNKNKNKNKGGKKGKGREYDREDDDGSYGNSHPDVQETSSTFPPGVALAVGLAMGAAIAYIIVKKVMKKPRHHHHMMTVDSYAPGDEGITLNTLRANDYSGGGGKGDANYKQGNFGNIDEPARTHTRGSQDGGGGFHNFAKFDEGGDNIMNLGRPSDIAQASASPTSFVIAEDEPPAPTGAIQSKGEIIL